MAGKLLCKKDFKITDISLDLDYYTSFRLKIYHDIRHMIDILNGGFYLRSTGYRPNNVRDIKRITKNYPSMVPSLSFLDLIIKSQEESFHKKSLDVGMFVNLFVENNSAKKSMAQRVENAYLNGENVYELNKEEYDMSRNNLQKIEFLDMLFVPKSNNPKMVFNSFVKKDLRKKINNNLKLESSRIEDLINLVAKEKGFFEEKEDTKYIVRNNLKQDRRMYRKKISQWLRDGGNYDLF